MEGGDWNLLPRMCGAVPPCTLYASSGLSHKPISILSQSTQVAYEIIMLAG
jgi:hypothetical protein